MIVFKCTKCGGLQYSSCLRDDPCVYCGGKIQVHDVEREEEIERDSRDKRGTGKSRN